MAFIKNPTYVLGLKERNSPDFNGNVLVDFSDISAKVSIQVTATATEVTE